MHSLLELIPQVFIDYVRFRSGDWDGYGKSLICVHLTIFEWVLMCDLDHCPARRSNHELSFFFGKDIQSFIQNRPVLPGIHYAIYVKTTARAFGGETAP